jgi:hypothetical protein
MSELNRANVLRELALEVQRDLHYQITDSHHPDYGAWVSPTIGLAEPGHGGTTRYLASCGLLVIARQMQPVAAPDQPATATLLHRMQIAADYLLRAQRSTGLIDLLSTNYDSSPDTGFAVQLLCALTELGRDHDLLTPVLSTVETFVRRAVPGMLAGGFHTPNHRWVIVGALAQAAALFPDLDVRAVVEAYTAEGFDVDAEGTYLERSVGVYDAVTNRSLLLYADNWDDADEQARVKAAVTANLDLNLHLLHADGTAETGLSRRQDYGTRTVPEPLIAAYLHAAVRYGNPLYTRAAQWLWSCAQPGHISNLAWMAYTLLKFGDPQPVQAELPTQFIQHYPLNNFWRMRHGQLSATVFGGVRQLISLVYGAAELNSITISQTYFGVGHFIADQLTAHGQSVTLRSEGRQRTHRPGYELPLGRPVDREEWETANVQRDWKPIPPATSTLHITAQEDGFACHYQTLDGLDKVATEIAFDFAVGGFWETADTAFTTQPGQVIILKQGYGRMRFGTDVIEIGPGAGAHRYEYMRHTTPPAPGLCRVLMTFVTPVDHRFSIRAFSGLG